MSESGPAIDQSLVFASTEVFNREASLQSEEQAPAVFYSCKDFTGTVGRRKWGEYVSLKSFAKKALKLFPRGQELQI